MTKKCSATVSGRYGPVVEPQVPKSPISGKFVISANAYDPDSDGSIKNVQFEVRNSAGDAVYTTTDTKSPYCLAGGSCNALTPFENWPGTNNKITNGTYTLYIQAIDNDGSNNYEHRTRRVVVFTLNNPTPTPSPTPACVANGTGLRGDYYNWEAPPSNKPVFGQDITNYITTRSPEPVDFNWGSNRPMAGVNRDYFAVRWTGRILPMYSETYTFYVKSNDGARMWVNGQEVASYWSNHDAVMCPGASSGDCKSKKITLQACKQYDIRVEYYDATGSASIQIYWESASQELEVIPRENLYPSQGPLPATSTPPPKTNTPKPTIKPTNTPTYTPRPRKPTNTPTPKPPRKTPTRTPKRTPTRTPTRTSDRPTNTPTITPTPTRRPPPTAG